MFQSRSINISLMLVAFISCFSFGMLSADLLYKQRVEKESQPIQIQGHTFQKICVLNGLWTVIIQPNGRVEFHYVDCNQVPHVDVVGQLPKVKQSI